MNIKSKYNSLNESQKSIVKMLGILLSLIIVFIIIFIIIASINGGKKSYQQVETIMKRAAEKYILDNPSIISEGVSSTVDIDVDTLANGKYMKSFDKYFGKNNTCTGKVIVYKNLDYKNYIPKIDCGESYKTVSLFDVITSSDNIVTKESGLYNVNGKYIYRGEYVENYVYFANQLWRILDITDNGEIRIFQDSSDYDTVWDDRYNSEYQDYVGINSYDNIEPSRIKESIIDLYNNKEVLSDDDKSYIIPKEYCVGKRYESDSSKDGSSECSERTDIMGATTFIVSDYLSASLDPKCVNIYSTECENYNYMANLKKSVWTVTADKENSKKAYAISYGITKKSLTSTFALRLVVTINGNVDYISGDGTLDNPYKIN